MTGAPLPEDPRGFDLLLKVEDVLKRRSPSGEWEIEFSPADASPHHVRRCGTDFRAGDLVASAGQTVDSPILMALAALGIREVSVFRKPVVWLISTGNELVEAFSDTASNGGRRPGQIRNSTAPFLRAELERLGCEVRGPVLVSDEVGSGSATFEKVLETALSEEVDLVISTGAVSMGVHDIVREGVLACGGDPGFHRVAIRPGKPVLLASFSSHPRTLFFGLPGNPVSTAVGIEFFVRPWLRAIHALPEPAMVPARLVANVSKPRELRCFCKARWRIDGEGRSVVEIVSGQASFMIHSYRGANAWAVLPEGESDFKAGAFVEVRFFNEGMGGNPDE
jgi:molybdopterin molybdotransferase